MEGTGVFRDDVRREDGRDAADVIAEFLIAVGGQGKNDRRVAGSEIVVDPVDHDPRAAGGEDDHLRNLVDMRREGVMGHFPDEKLVLAVLVEGIHEGPPGASCTVIRNSFSCPESGIPGPGRGKSVGSGTL